MINQSTFIKPVITEKAFVQAKRGWYTFALGKGITKDKAKKIIENVYQVQVIKIKSSVIKGKNKRSPKTRIWKKESDLKKFIVTLAKDQKIAVFETSGK